MSESSVNICQQSKSLHQFFHGAIVGATTEQDFKASDAAIWYVVNMLVLFSRSDYGPAQQKGHRFWPALALVYKQAQEARDDAVRVRHLKYLGDLALLVVGFFSGSLSRRSVDVDYYVGMGGGAYASLSSLHQRVAPGETEDDVFGELAEKFTGFVDVLNAVQDNNGALRDKDLLRWYEQWMLTRSEYAASKLRAYGIEPAHVNTIERRH